MPKGAVAGSKSRRLNVTTTSARPLTAVSSTDDRPEDKRNPDEGVTVGVEPERAGEER